MKTIDMYEINEEVFIKAKIQDIIVENGELKYKLTIEDSTNPLDHKYSYSQITPIVKNCFHDSPEDEDDIGTGELYPGEFESRHYEFEDCDNIKGERVIKCREEEDGSSRT